MVVKQKRRGGEYGDSRVSVILRWKLGVCGDQKIVHGPGDGHKEGSK